MRRRQLIAAALAATVVLGLCLLRLWPPTVGPAEAAELETVADGWCRRHPTGDEVPPADWPAAVRRLRLERVRVSAEGVYLVRGSFFVSEWGWFVLRDGSAFRPSAAGDPTYWPVRGRVYRYQIAG